MNVNIYNVLFVPWWISLK